MCEGEGHRTGARHLDRGSRGAKQREFCCPLHFLTLGKSDLPWQAALHAGGGTFPAWDYDSGPRARRWGELCAGSRPWPGRRPSPHQWPLCPMGFPAHQAPIAMCPDIPVSDSASKELGRRRGHRGTGSSQCGRRAVLRLITEDLRDKNKARGHGSGLTRPTWMQVLEGAVRGPVDQGRTPRSIPGCWVTSPLTPEASDAGNCRHVAYAPGHGEWCVGWDGSPPGLT